jgi:hypothetical protein
MANMLSGPRNINHDAGIAMPSQGEAPLPSFPAFEPLPVFDIREKLSELKEDNDRQKVNTVFQKMSEQAESYDSDPFIKEYELGVERAQVECESRIVQRQRRLAGQQKGSSEFDRLTKEIKELRKEYRNIPLKHLTRFAQEGTRIQKQHNEWNKKLRKTENEIARAKEQRTSAQADKDKDESKILELDERIEEMDTNKDELEGRMTENIVTQREYQRRKIILLKRLLGEHIREKDNKGFKHIVESLISKIQHERKAQSRELYNEDAILLFIYQLTYRYYLWQGELRKDGKTSYFLSHIVAAVETLINQGFTGAATMQAAASHDDLEDLILHREDPNNKKSPINPRLDWFFCPIDVYQDQVQGPLEDTKGTKGTKGARSTQEDIRDKAYSTVTGVTKWIEAPEGVEETPEERRLRDEENLKEFYRGVLVHRAHSALIRVGEQPQNFRTIGNLSQERQEPKIDEIVRNWLPINANFELWEIYHDMVRSLINHYHPDMLAQFNKLQTERIKSRLSKTSVSRGMKTLIDILLPRKEGSDRNTSIKNQIDEWIETFGKPNHEVTEARQGISNRVHAAFAPFQDKIQSVEIVPKPLEHTDYIPDVQQIRENSNFFPEIAEEDPMFEIVVLVDNLDDVYATATDIQHRIMPEKRPTLNPSKPETGRPYRGVSLNFDDVTLGPGITIRVNTVHHEAMAKRGVRVDLESDKLPDWTRQRIQYALREVEDGAMTISEAVDRIIGQKFMTAHSAIGHTKELRLQENATFLDAARAISHKTLTTGTRAFRQRKRADGKLYTVDKKPVSFYDTVEPDDHITIETGEAHLDLIDMVFMEDPGTKVAARAHFQQVEQEDARAEAERRVLKMITEADKKHRQLLKVRSQKAALFDNLEEEFGSEHPETKLARKAKQAAWKAVSKADRRTEKLKADLERSKQIFSLQQELKKTKRELKAAEREYRQTKQEHGFQHEETTQKRATRDQRKKEISTTEKRIKQLSKNHDNLLEKERIKVRDETHQARGEEYLHQIQGIFGINDDELLKLLSLRTQKEFPQKALDGLRGTIVDLLAPSLEQEAAEEAWRVDEDTITRAFSGFNDDEFARLLEEAEIEDEPTFAAAAEAFASKAERQADKRVAALHITNLRLARLMSHDRRGRDLSLPLRKELVGKVEDPTSFNVLQAEERKLKLLIKNARKKYRENLEGTLKRIGNGNFNPLKTLAPFVDRSRGCVLIIKAPNASGVLGDIGIECKALNINISPPQKIDLRSVDNMKFPLQVPENINNYDLLKFILKLKLKYAEQGWDVSVENSSLFAFGRNEELTDQLQIAHEMAQEQ